ncbi:MAG: RES family NAD+ phosphorylase [Ruminococcus sp.]|nr:RES family NAD+ phosphorylase [Ruminococcus sp.]
MEKSEEIINNLSNKFEKMRCKGIKFIRIPVWDEFANHIVYVNRFGSSEMKEVVCNFLDSMLKKNSMIYHIAKDTIIYRARKIKRNEIKKNTEGIFEGFDEKNSGIPPYRETPNGRVNIAGIPILYTATEKETACAELRPMKNDYISVAEYKIIDDINVANFVLEQIPNFEKEWGGQLFLKDMFRSFSLPISNELIDYLPSEFISEYIRLKHTDLSGIRYSSLHNLGGYNVALFDYKKCKFIKSTVVECSKVNYQYNELNDIT